MPRKPGATQVDVMVERLHSTNTKCKIAQHYPDPPTLTSRYYYSYYILCNIELIVF